MHLELIIVNVLNGILNILFGSVFYYTSLPDYRYIASDVYKLDRNTVDNNKNIYILSIFLYVFVS